MNKQILVFLPFLCLLNAQAEVVIHQESVNLKLYRASIGEKVIALQGSQADLRDNPFNLDPKKCSVLEEKNNLVTLDCTKEFEEVAGQPSSVKVVLRAQRREDGSYVSQFRCRLGEIEVALKRQAWENAREIGFYFNGLGTDRYADEGRSHSLKTLLPSDRFFTIQENQEVGIFTFATLANCWKGSGTSSLYANYAFKPFVTFKTEEKTYKNWDNRPGAGKNYILNMNNSRIDFSADF